MLLSGKFLDFLLPKVFFRGFLTYSDRISGNGMCEFQAGKSFM